MGSLGGLIIILASFLCLFLVLVLIKVFYKLWWTPIRIQKQMASQGIKGPSYKLIHGNTKEIFNMRKEVMDRPKVLSHDILSVVQPHIHSWTKIYGKNYLQWHGFQAQLVIAEPELCKEILNNKDRAYPKRDSPIFVKKLLGDGLVATTEAEKWTKLRKLATHAFHGESLKSMFPEMVASAETMIERWKIYDGKEIEVFEEFRLFTSEVISRTAFGSSYIEGKKIFEMLIKLGSLLVRNFLTVRVPGISKFFKTSDEIEAGQLEKEVHASIVEMVKKREKKVMTGEIDNFGSDFLGLLLKAHHDANDKQMISVDELIDECKTFYFAGQETTNTLLSWTIFLLALHTDWQEEARKEVIQIFGKQTPTLDGIAKMRTMSMIINEALRLYPPAVFMIRKVEREVRLGKLIVPANVELVVSTIALHHDPQIWGQDVQLFKPDRFSEGVAKATNNNVGAYIPFGMGPRTCVGLNFAANEAKVALLFKTSDEIESKKLEKGIRESILEIVKNREQKAMTGEDVHLFKPERFSEGIAKATKNNIAAFLPFGMGPRNCVGLDYATTEAKIALSTILQRYSFSLSPGYLHSHLEYTTVRPEHGVQVMLHSL